MEDQFELERTKALSQTILSIAARQMAVQKILEDAGVATRQQFLEALQWAEEQLAPLERAVETLDREALLKLRGIFPRTRLH